jgi:predicted nucleic acid-binding protein
VANLVYDGIAMIDSCAVIALFDPTERFYRDATAFFEAHGPQLRWTTLNETAHELFTRVRYRNGLAKALDAFDFLRNDQFRAVAFEIADEELARKYLERYGDQTLSFHDALCAAVMRRMGIYKIFSFDRDFFTFGFHLLPGVIAQT